MGHSQYQQRQPNETESKKGPPKGADPVTTKEQGAASQEPANDAAAAAAARAKQKKRAEIKAWGDDDASKDINTKKVSAVSPGTSTKVVPMPSPADDT